MDHRHRITRRLPIAGLVLVSTVLAIPGCAKRHQLGDTDLPEVGSASVTDVRVYASRRTVAVYDEAKTPAPGDTVNRRKMVVSRNTRGAVVGEDVLDGKRRLWVTFDLECSATKCAYGFVADGGRYVMSSVPAIEGFTTTGPDPGVYLLIDEGTATTASVTTPDAEG